MFVGRGCDAVVACYSDNYKAVPALDISRASAGFEFHLVRPTALPKLPRPPFPPALISPMSATPYTPDSLESLLKKLSLTEDAPDHEEILKHANNVLKSSKGNPRALHTKVVALLNLDRHEDALRVFTSNNDKIFLDIAVLEHAYCLYKVGKLQDALDLSQTVLAANPNARALKHIAAQTVSYTPG